MERIRNQLLDRYPVLLGYIAAVVTTLLIIQIVQALR